MSDPVPPSDTPPGIEEIDGTEYEYPYRVEDFQGRIVADELDNIPPLLNHEQVDVLAGELEDILEERGVLNFTEQRLASVLEALPDSEHGRGGTPDWLTKTE